MFKKIFQKHQRLIIFLSLLTIIAFIGFILSQTNTASPIQTSPAFNITPSPSYSDATSSAQTLKYPAPKSVVWNDVQTQTLDTVLPAYQTTSTPLTVQSTLPLAQKLGFTSTPQTIQTEYISIINWSSDKYHLGVDIKTSSINYGFNDSETARVTGDYLPTEELTVNTISLIKDSRLFDSQVEFNYLYSTYLSSDQEWFTPISPEESDVILITLTPHINNYPIFKQESNFIEAIYNRENQLIKLTIKNPFSIVSTKNQIPLMTYQQLAYLPASRFFRLLVEPKTQSDFFFEANDISTLYPTNVNLGYYLEQNVINPIFIIQKEDSYYYAAFAEHID